LLFLPMRDHRSTGSFFALAHARLLYSEERHGLAWRG
jgi:hypothetical protein